MALLSLTGLRVWHNVRNVELQGWGTWGSSTSCNSKRGSLHEGCTRGHMHRRIACHACVCHQSYPGTNRVHAKEQDPTVFLRHRLGRPKGGVRANAYRLSGGERRTGRIRKLRRANSRWKTLRLIGSNENEGRIDGGVGLCDCDEVRVRPTLKEVSQRFRLLPALN